MRKAHDLMVETEYIGVLYIIVRVIFQFHFVASFTVQKSFFIRTTRIWNLLITRLDLDNVTFENFKSVLYGYYSRALAINYDPDSPRSFKSICLKCNTARFLDQETSCCMWFKLLLLYLLFFWSAVIGLSYCIVPAQIFKLLLVYCYVLINSVCISSVFFLSVCVFFRAKLIK